MQKGIFLVIMLLTSLQIAAQQLTQTVKGKVTDATSGSPLPFVNVGILGTNPILGATTDDGGFFKIEKVPVGRYDVQASFVGYEVGLVKEVEVGSGKEVVLQIALREMATALDEVEVRVTVDKAVPDNVMAMISARTLSVEESRRYAGGFDDPARLASAFAGVAGGVGNNGIVIRGNAPRGLLWRMEGVEIPNPNHFADVTTFGAGGLTALSSQMLANSDFFTGAFPAEYGNGLSGVFDLQLRTGNADKPEHTLQFGLIGLDASSEGPFKKGGRSSYLFNYRYSTLALLGPILPKDAQGTRYQDLSFKLNFPTKKAGVFSVWGLAAGNISGQTAKDSTLWKYESDRMNAESKQRIGALGLTHLIFLGKDTYWQSTLAATGNGIGYTANLLDLAKKKHASADITYNTWKYTFTTLINHKFSAKHVNRTGIIANQWHYNNDFKEGSLTDPLQTIVQEQGVSWLLQAYTQSQITASKRLSFNVGAHAMHFVLTGRSTLEPRVGAKMRINSTMNMSFGYGLHSQTERLHIYLAQNEQGERPNQSLKFSKSHHLVLGYDWQFSQHLRLKVEPYWQMLFHIPVAPGTSFSLLNLDQNWFVNTPMTSTGKGRNVGIDVTLEHFLNKGFFYLATASIFDSQYTGGDGVWRSTRFNKNYVMNLLMGKEWKVGKSKANVLSISGRMTVQGGNRATPVNIQASQLAKDIVLDESRAFEERLSANYLASLTINYRKNKANHASVWSFKMLNALMQPEFSGYGYNYVTGGIDKRSEVLSIPNLSYKIEF